MKHEFHLLHSVNSEPVLHGISSRGVDNLQGVQNEGCLANVNLQFTVICGTH